MEQLWFIESREKTLHCYNRKLSIGITMNVEAASHRSGLRLPVRLTVNAGWAL